MPKRRKRFLLTNSSILFDWNNTYDPYKGAQNLEESISSVDAKI